MAAFRNRAQGGYRPFDTGSLAQDNYERIYTTYSPTEETDYCVKFDIRTPHQCHMSTATYLERKFRFRLNYRPATSVNFRVIDLAYEDRGIGNDPDEAESPVITYGDHLAVVCNSPGFTLQNCMKHFQMRFKDTHVIDKPSEWLAMYTHLYSHALRNYVKGSSGAFLKDRLIKALEPRNSPFVKDRMRLVRMNNRAGFVLDLYTFTNTHNFAPSVSTPPGPLRPILTDFYFHDAGALLMNRLMSDIDYYFSEGYNGTRDEDYGIAEELDADAKENEEQTLAQWRHAHNLGLAAHNKAPAARTPDNITHMQAAEAFFAETQIMKLALTDVTGRQRHIGAYPQAVIAIYEAYLNNPERYRDLDVNGHVTGPFVIMPRAFVDPAGEDEKEMHVDFNDFLHLYEHSCNIYQSNRYDNTHLFVNHVARFEYFREDRNLQDATNLGVVQGLVDGPEWETFTDAGKAVHTELGDIARTAFRHGHLRTLHFLLIETGKIFTEFGIASMRAHKDAGTLNLLWDTFNPAEKMRYIIFGDNDANPFYQWYCATYVQPNMDLVQIASQQAVRDEVANEVVLPPADTLPNVGALQLIQSEFELSFIEPLVCGLHKPGEGPQPGCWSNVGDIFPRVDRFMYQFDFEEDALARRLINVLENEDGTGELRVDLVPGYSTSKLHTVYYRGLLKPRVDLVLHDFETRNLGQAHFMANPLNREDHANVTVEFEFNYRTKPQPLYMIFHTVTNYQLESAFQSVPFCHQGPVIDSLTLHTNTRSRVFYYSGAAHERLELLTVNNFPQYTPMRDGFGACVVVPINKLPESVYMDPHDDTIRGKATLSIPDFMGTKMVSDIDYRSTLRLTLVYKDLHLELNDVGVRRVQDL